MPSHVVDRELQGWWRTDTGEYRTPRSPDAVPIERVMSRFAPLRTVGHAPESDLREAHEWLLVAGKHAAASVVAALALAVDELTAGFSDRGLPDPQARGIAALAAGDPASLRAELLPEAITIGHRVSEIPSCVCSYTRDQLAEVIVGWIRRPDPYVEVLGTMAALVSAVADTYGPTGWGHVADIWLQAFDNNEQDAVVCYQLLYSASRYYQHPAA